MVKAFIQTKKAQGKTVIFSTHYMEEAESLCDRIGLIHKGKIVSCGTKKDLQDLSGKETVRDIFLSYIDRGDEREQMEKYLPDMV